MPLFVHNLEHFFTMNILTAFNLRLDISQPEVISIVGGGGKSSTMFQLANEISASGKKIITTTTTNIGPAQTQNAPSVLRVEDDQLSMSELAALLTQHNHCLLVSPEKEATRGYKVSGISPQLVDTLARHSEELGVSAIVVEADGSHRLPIKAPAEYEPVVADSTTMLVPVAGLDCIGTLIRNDYVHRPEHVRRLLGLNLSHDGRVDNSESITLYQQTPRLSPNMVLRLLTSPDGGAKLLPNNARFMPIVTKVDTPIRLAAARLIASKAVQQGHSLFIASIVNTETVTEQRFIANAHRKIEAEQIGPLLERWAPAAIVVLAAGQSKRMGRSKQLEVVDGEAMVIRAVRTALQSPTQHVIVVLGAYAEQIREALSSSFADSLSAVADQQLHLVHNGEWLTGQASSVRCAIDFLKTNSALQAALFMPVDQPFIQPQLLRSLLRKWQKGARLVAPLLYGKPRGAPALFDRTLWSELQQLSGDSGARSVLQKYSVELSTVPATAPQLFDIDSPSDLEKVS